MRRLGTILAARFPEVAQAERKKLEEAFASGLRMFGRDIPEPVREHRFDAERRWRFDFAWPDAKVAVEIHGGAHLGQRGGHTSAKGLHRDAEKSSAAAMAGWLLLTLTGEDVHLRRLPASIDKVRRALEVRAKERA